MIKKFLWSVFWGRFDIFTAVRISNLNFYNTLQGSDCNNRCRHYHICWTGNVDYNSFFECVFAENAANGAMKWRMATICKANHISVMLLGSLYYCVRFKWKDVRSDEQKEVISITKVKWTEINNIYKVFGFQTRLLCIFQITKERV
jgi:hypothetical protein